MRWIKWVAGVAVALIALVIAAIWVITSLVNPNQFKGRIEAAVRETTGYPFEIRGDIDITWYPWLGVKTGPAQLGRDEPLAQWQSARVGAKLIPLLRGRLEISRIGLDGLHLNLRRAADGRPNWEALLAHRGKPQSSPERPLEIGGLQIRNGSAELSDQSRKVHIKVSDWRLDMDSWKPGTPFAISTRLVLQNGKSSAVRIPIELAIPKLSVGTSPLTVVVPEFSWRIAGAHLRGSVSLKDAAPMQAQGALSFETASVRKLLADLGIGGPRPRDAMVLGELRMSTHWALLARGITLKPIEMQLDQTKFKGELSRSASETPVWSFDLHGNRIELDRYVALQDVDDEPFELPFEALKALQARGVVRFDEAQLAGAVMKVVLLRLELADGKLSGAPPT